MGLSLNYSLFLLAPLRFILSSRTSKLISTDVFFCSTNEEFLVDVHSDKFSLSELNRSLQYYGLAVMGRFLCTILISVVVIHVENH